MEQKAKTRPSPDRRSSTPLGDKHGATIAPKTAMTAAKVVHGRQAPPATLVIFGAGGDLTKRLVVPALYHLVQAGKLPDAFAVIGLDHNDRTTEQWRQSLSKMMQAFTQAAGIDAQAWSWLIQRMHYMRGDFTQPEAFRNLKRRLAERQQQNNTDRAARLRRADPAIGGSMAAGDRRKTFRARPRVRGGT